MEVLNEDKLKEAIDNIAKQIKKAYLDSHYPLAIVGIKSRGDILAERIRNILAKEGIEINKHGSLDITLYRDDLDQIGSDARVEKTDIDFDINQYEIILVDDVLFTGRTVRAALDALMDLGRPKAVKLAVLVDRNKRELPIQPDFVGIRLENVDAHVQVKLKELDGEDCIILRNNKDEQR